MALNAVEKQSDTTDGGRFRAPLFREMTERLGRDRRRVILDLGPATGGTLGFLQFFRCRLVVADAADALDALSGSTEDPAVLAEQVRGMIPDTGPEPVDAVLCWDIFNYLSKPALSALGERLGEIVRPGGMIHALIDIGNPRISRFPARYAVAGEDELIQEITGPVDRSAPRYTPWDLEKHGRNFSVERSVMLRNRMQEYLLRLQEAPTGPREVKALYRTAE